jgi:methylated-DNA-[protein]-cysteine S-methyltransferase
MYYYTNYPSPLGALTLACRGKDLVGLWIANQKYYGAAILKAAVKNDGAEAFGAVKEWLNEYFAGGRPDPRRLSLAPEGGEFYRSVWDILLTVPYGETLSYGAAAKKLAGADGRAAPYRAVGSAVARNPISVIIPCHRVIRSDGGLSGYAGGIENKIKLLTLEGVDTAKFT